MSKTKNHKPNKSYFPWIITITALIVVVAITIIVIFINQTATPSQTTQATQTPAGVINDGFVLTKTGLATTNPQPVETTFENSEYDSTENNITVYLDYSCPHCAAFEQNSFAQIETWLEEGTIDTLSLHPIAFLTEYSAIAANAATCTAQYDPTNFLLAHKTLMANYDQNLTVNQTYKKLVAAGIPDTTEYSNCVKGGEYNTFVQKATERALKGPIPQSSIQRIEGTPTVLINGQKYPTDPSDLQAFTTFTLNILKPETTNG